MLFVEMPQWQKVMFCYLGKMNKVGGNWWINQKKYKDIFTVQIKYADYFFEIFSYKLFWLLPVFVQIIWTVCKVPKIILEQ